MRRVRNCVDLHWIGHPCYSTSQPEERRTETINIHEGEERVLFYAVENGIIHSYLRGDAVGFIRGD